MGARIAAIYRYPVKGLSPQALATTIAAPGQSLPFDRAYAIENGRGRFDPERPQPLPKVNFLMLMRNERLAALDTHFDETRRVLVIRQAGRVAAQGALDEAAGRHAIEQFIAGYLAGELAGAPRIVRAPGHSFSDKAEKCIHLVNLASVRALEQVLGSRLDPLRFRANIYFEADTPWRELEWIGQEMTVGDARLAVFDRTSRCAATNVEPGTGRRDLDIPGTLMRTFGHTDFGIYARVVAGGRIRVGDVIAQANTFRDPLRRGG